MFPKLAAGAVFNAAASLVLPARCILCGVSGTGLCSACATTLPPAPDLAPPDMVDRCWSLLEYAGPSCRVVAALKYGNHHDALGWLTRAMALLPDRRPDVVTWAPTTRHRRAARGFDQAELLAHRIGEHLEVPTRRLLTKRPSAAQTGASRSARLGKVRFDPVCTPPPHVLVVDDVRTTGATLTAATAALRSSGATHVDAVTLAATL